MTQDNDGYDEQTIEKIQMDWMHCRSSEMMAVDEMYRYAVGNPQLLQSPEAGATDCLHQHNLVETTYTAAQFSADYESYLATPDDQLDQYDGTLDFTEPEVLNCLVANGIDVLSAREGDTYAWRPLN